MAWLCLTLQTQFQNPDVSLKSVSQKTVNTAVDFISTRVFIWGPEAATKTKFFFFFNFLCQEPSASATHTHKLSNFSERFKMPTTICLQ